MTSPVSRILEANERIADLAHRSDTLRRERDFARRLAVWGWIAAGALAAALASLVLA